MEYIREVSLLATDQTNEWIAINDNSRSQLDKIFGMYTSYVQETTKEPQRQINGMTVLLRVFSTGLNGFLTQDFLQYLSPIYHSRLFGMNRNERQLGPRQVLEKTARTSDKKMTRVPNGIRAMFPDVSTQGSIYLATHPMAESIQLLAYSQDNRKPPPPGPQPVDEIGDQVTITSLPPENKDQVFCEGNSNQTPIVIDETCSPPKPQDSDDTEMADDDRKPEASTGYRSQDIGTDYAEDTDDDDTLSKTSANRKRRRV